MPDDTVRLGASTGHADAALVRAVAAMRPGWLVLRDCQLACGDGGARALVCYALLHPDVGVALLDVLPGATTPGAPDRLRRSLEAGTFPEVFGGYPPIIHLCVPSHSLPGLGLLLGQEFRLLPPLALAHGRAWVGCAQRMLTAEPPLCGQARVAAEERRPLIRPPGPARVEGRRAPHPNYGWRGLAAFSGSVALAFGGAALVLQHLRPPSDGPPARRAAASPGGPYTSRTASNARPATASATHRDVAWSPQPDPVPTPWAAERPPVFPAAEATRTGAAIRETNAAGSAGPAAGRDHSEPAAPAAPDGGPERSSVQAAHASAHPGSAANASAAMDATGSNAGAVDGTPVPDAPEGEAPSAGSSTAAAADAAEGLAGGASAPARAAGTDRPGERQARAASASGSVAANAVPPPSAASSSRGGLPKAASLAEGSDPRPMRPMPAASADEVEAPREGVAAEQARLEALGLARAAAGVQLAQLQEEARRDEATRHGIPTPPGAALASSSSVTAPLPSPRSTQAGHAPGAAGGAPPSGAAVSNSGHQRVVLHHRAGSHAASEAAGAMAAQVREAGFDLGGTRAVNATPSQPVVRYFRAEDAPAATSLVGRLGRGWALQDFRGYEPPPAPGLLEVWLPDR